VAKYMWPELPPIIGGVRPAAFERTAKYGEGWIMGGGALDQFKDTAAKVDAAWQAAGRKGAPRKMSLAYFALGEGAREAADRYLQRYYAWLAYIAGMIAASAATDADTVRQYIQVFSDAGCDELVLFPCSPDPEQVDLLADAAGLGSPQLAARVRPRTPGLEPSTSSR
jgi:alkanesulfonate monooxygenase SsuD/methylene tetrahydromethanopterin reductase-like flavin-dependent oxidoreductase (luciferase family)